MRRRVRLLEIFVVALGALAAGASARADERIVVSTGADGGSYFYIGERLKTNLIIRGELPPETITSQGSLDNLARLDDPASPVNVALAQADALRTYLVAHPTFSERFFLLGDMGRECALLVTSRENAANSASDLLGDASSTLSVDAPGSGAAVTFTNMVSLQPAFAATEAVFVPTLEALLQIKVGGEFNRLEAALMMQRPRRLSPALDAVLSDPDHYRFIPIAETDLPNAFLPDGTPVYSFELVTVGGKNRSKAVEIASICTRALLLGSNDKLDRKLRSRLSQLMLETGAAIAGDDE